MVTVEPACKGGQLLVRALNDRGWTLEKGEHEAGFSEGYFSRLLKKGGANISAASATKLRKVYRIPVTAWQEPVTCQAKTGAKPAQAKRKTIREGVRRSTGRAVTAQAGGPNG